MNTTQRISWTDDMIREEASKHKSASDFRKGNITAYRGLLDDVCKHMELRRISWTDDMIRKVKVSFKKVMIQHIKPHGGEGY